MTARTSRSAVSARRLGAMAALLAGTTLLGACAPLLIGGAMVGGTMMAVDRRTSGAQVEDEAIELKGMARAREVLGNTGHVNITSYNRLVLVTGEVPAENDKAALEAALGRTDNLRSIVNELAVMSNSSIGSRSNDALITTKVKASLVDARDLLSSAFKVVTERSVVYLLGRVTEREATRAAEVASGVPGVEKVVRVFEIISEDDLAGKVRAP
jgi:osmotically-inducible protein OsmY